MKRLIHRIKGLFAVSFLDSIYKLLIFGDLFRVMFPILMKRYIGNTRKKQEKTLAELKNKPLITVAFFLQTPSTWKYDALYKRLKQSSRFKPIVVVCPYNVHLNYSKAECLRIMEQTENFARNQAYDYISAYDHQKKTWVNIKKILNPDIVFFTKPYKDTLPAYYIYRFREKITCYIAYGVCLLRDRVLDNYDLPLHNLLYHFFLETELNIPYPKQYALSKGDNIVLSGNLGMERLMNKNYKPADVWKAQSAPKKRLIWAPHHTVNYLFNSSNFLIYCDFMLALAKKYEDKIQWAFKPHPVLKFRLINLWGEQRAEDYYNQWKTMNNTQLEEGYYDDLFLTSDAMLHDSITFTAEYIYTDKPVLFMVRDQSMSTCWNEFGLMAFDLHYHAHNEREIEDFIEKVVLNDDDPMSDARKKFYDEYLYPKDGIMPSEKIYRIIEEETT